MRMWNNSSENTEEKPGNDFRLLEERDNRSPTGTGNITKTQSV